jgi:pyridoxamine 5'-phosphate oxidase
MGENENTLTGNPKLVNPGFDLPPQNPLDLFKEWLIQAESLKVVEHKGMVLSTVGNLAYPSSRVVLLREIDDQGVIFATSEVSKKGLDLLNNPFAAGTLWWRETMQQINLQGMVRKLSSKVSDKIFSERTRYAQALAARSKQSATMQDEDELRETVVTLAKQSEVIKRPEHWHAYHIKIYTIEFWLGSQDRFHQRLKYNLKDGVWNHRKLQP